MKIQPNTTNTESELTATVVKYVYRTKINGIRREVRLMSTGFYRAVVTDLATGKESDIRQIITKEMAIALADNMKLW